MNKIIKIIGAVVATGATAIAGGLLYQKGYKSGYDEALHDCDKEYSNDEDDEEDYGDEYFNNDKHMTLPVAFTTEEFYQARDIIKNANRASISFLMREMHIQYPKAKAIIQHMEEMGYVSPLMRGNWREVHIEDRCI